MNLGTNLFTCIEIIKKSKITYAKNFEEKNEMLKWLDTPKNCEVKLVLNK